jgi:hypothetical protein
VKNWFKSHRNGGMIIRFETGMEKISSRQF